MRVYVLAEVGVIPMAPATVTTLPARKYWHTLAVLLETFDTRDDSNMRKAAYAKIKDLMLIDRMKKGGII